MNNRIILREIKKLRNDITREYRVSRYWNVTTFLFSVALVFLGIGFTFWISGLNNIAQIYYYGFFFLLIIVVLISTYTTLKYGKKKK